MKNPPNNRYAAIKKSISSAKAWLEPGLGIKRWFVLVLAGTMIISIGVADILLDVFRESTNEYLSQILYYGALLFLPSLLRSAIFGSIGIFMILYGFWGFNRSILQPFVTPGKPVIDTVAHFRRRGRGPRIVVIGGGHGQATLLRGLKKHTTNLTAIVTVADDGGSSGRLRDSMGILPPGDIRNCLAALSNDEDLITQLFQYRFAQGDNQLEGHSFGNLFISALSDLTGSFEEAVAESGRVLSVHGRVLPSTLHDVQLIADKTLPHLTGEVRVHGESNIPEIDGKVRQVWLEPNNPPAFPEAIREILRADMIVIAPGSLFTSILPNLLVPDIAAAIRSSQAFKVFVCNVATQPGETDGYDCLDHIEAIDSHVGNSLFDIVIANAEEEGKLPKGVDWVAAPLEFEGKYPLYRANLIDWDQPSAHNADKLAQVLIDLLLERTGPLV
ncbi:MAG: YvcK family protein [Chloroflexi bacterium]|jgi:uncharacterized cofD-like protein|nr:YvcK family protein [Chloroflexota bacterium]MBT3668846.1 YvcK family protein [Chloroflexota bacterium]MBT4533944.1 YvcK family protein [Chloroflexota bacterium]MBT4681453.1 YvcK family protein [Chloroflexota bacterium]MBT4754287.1 YvcK family protein [Chloroflexota bacterium]